MDEKYDPSATWAALDVAPHSNSDSKISSKNDLPAVGGDEQLPNGPVLSLWKQILIVAICTTGLLLNIFSATTLSIALPTVGRHFNVGEDELQWLISAYSLSSGSLLIFFGRLADLHGRKLAFLIGTAWLGIFALGCAFVQSITVFYVLRGLQGLGAAALLPASVGILAHAFPPSHARSIAFATFSAGAPVGGALGLFLSCFLTQYSRYTWRSLFFPQAGLAALCFIGGYLVIDKDQPSSESDRRVDWLGAALVTTGLVFVTFVLGQGELAGWTTPYILVLLVLGVIILGLFICWEYYLERHPGKYCAPLMPLSMWSRAGGKFAVMQGVAFMEWSSFISWTFWSQLYYQDYLGLSPVHTALRFLPMCVTGLTLNAIVALIIGRVDIVVIVVIGTTFTGIAGLLFALIQPQASYWAFGFPAAITSVFGADFVFASGSLFIAKVCLPHEQSLGGGLFQTLTQLGTAFGLTITTIIHNRVLRDASTALGVSISASGVGAPASARLDAYKAAQWGSFVFAIIGSVLAVMFLRGIGIVGTRGK